MNMAAKPYVNLPAISYVAPLTATAFTQLSLLEAIAHLSRKHVDLEHTAPYVSCDELCAYSVALDLPVQASSYIEHHLRKMRLVRLVATNRGRGGGSVLNFTEDTSLYDIIVKLASTESTSGRDALILACRYNVSSVQSGAKALQNAIDRMLVEAFQDVPWSSVVHRRTGTQEAQDFETMLEACCSSSRYTKKPVVKFDPKTILPKGPQSVAHVSVFDLALPPLRLSYPAADQAAKAFKHVLKDE